MSPTKVPSGRPRHPKREKRKAKEKDDDLLLQEAMALAAKERVQLGTVEGERDVVHVPGGCCKPAGS
eukprot:12917607-Prorocentrum_lima.AAC.1